MTTVTISMGWRIWLKALSEPRSLADAAAWMYRLNVFARTLGRHAIVDQIYWLKNDLVQYLYQHGYATEVLLHEQKRFCHSCGGTGVYWTGGDCFKCDGTGVFAVTELYAFRFVVDGHVYKWHQLKKMVDYPITLTNPQSAPFIAPPERDEAPLAMDAAWLGCCVVWWFLLGRGMVSRLMLFSATWVRLKNKIEPIGRLFFGWTFELRRRWSAFLDTIIPLNRCEECRRYYWRGVDVHGKENRWPGHRFCSVECSSDWVPF